MTTTLRTSLFFGFLPAFALSLLVLGSLLLGAGCTGPTVVDGEPEPDMVEPDVTMEPDAEPEPPPTGRAHVFLTHPNDDPALVEVTIPAPTTEDGSLTNAYVNALNCTNKDGGAAIFGVGNLCVEEKTVFPDEEGNYRHVMPPEVESGEDPFAELQMYHHVNVVHDYFKSSFGFSDLDFPLDAVVNLTVKLFGDWQSFPNAAFIPAESFAAFGLPARDFGAIMFGQGDTVDFSYDSSVIYHEYSHAVAGPGRLNAAFLDAQGMNNTPGAINEGLADYFAAAILDDPLVGPYALGAQKRDLLDPRTCPGNLTTEIHADGKIIGSALWAARTELGTDLDRVVFQAMIASTQTTGMEEYGQLLVAEAGDVLDAAKAQRFEEILVEFGVVGCERIRPWEEINFALGEGVPHQVEGTQSFQGGSLPDGVPGYHQWSLTVPEGVVVRLTWTLGGGGGPFGGAPSPLALALRRGSPIQIASFTGSIIADELLDAPPLDANNAQVLQLDTTCLPAGGGDIYLMFRNTGQGGSGVMGMDVGFFDNVNASLPVASCQ